MTKKKVLLMGKSGSGKTSMRSIIFANYVARDTMRLSPTLDVEHSHVRFLGDLVLNLWDCGGQEAFYESYLEMQRSTIFRGVEVLIYVFDVESHNLDKDVAQFVEVLDAIHENSQQAKIFVLIHKMDLIPENDRNRVFLERQQIIRDASKYFEPTFFQTSIWFETLYKAWSSIVYSLIPNTEMLESRLRQFCSICSADEVVLFERATFLVISHVTDETKTVTADVHRFEKISNIIKQFKLSCSKLQSQFTGLEIRNSKFSAFIDSFTTNTCIMVIVSDPDVYGAAIRLNTSVAKQSFEEFFNSP